MGGEAGDGCVKRFMSLLYGVLRVPAFGGGVWRGCRHAAKPCPGSRGLQTSRGVTVAGTGLVSCLFQPLEHRKDRGNVEIPCCPPGRRLAGVRVTQGVLKNKDQAPQPG